MRSRRNFLRDQFLRGDFWGLGGEPWSWQAEQRHTLEGRDGSEEVLLRESSPVLLEEWRWMMGTGALRPRPARSGWPESLCRVVGESLHGESLLRPREACLGLSGDAGNARRCMLGESERSESQLLRPREARRRLSGDRGNCSLWRAVAESVERRESLLWPSEERRWLSGDKGSCMTGTGPGTALQGHVSGRRLPGESVD